MQDTLAAILKEAQEGVTSIKTRAEFESFKAKISGPKGSFTLAGKQMGKVPKEERPAMGKLINETKKGLEIIWAETSEALASSEFQSRLGTPVDPTLPSPDKGIGTHHPLTQVRDQISAIFRKIGFVIAEGPELETEWYCFDALNTPEDHPARDAQDTLFLPKTLEAGNVDKHADEDYILRTHTSTVQIRTMLKTPPPVRIIAPGRCFRRDTVDATHSANFHQAEGLYIDKDVTIKDLKAVLDYFIRQIFGEDAQTRLRPSFFPFTEPSFEMDFMSPDLGKLSNKWMEIMGCGMVDPNVIKNVGLDPEVWSGFAFGMGVERVAMLKHGIDDIRHFYANDLRFLKQFA